MTRNITINRLLISNEIIKNMEAQFDTYYFKIYQSFLEQNEELAFKLEHRNKGITVHISHTNSILHDLDFIVTIQKQIQEEIIQNLKKIFPDNTKFSFEKIMDGFFEFSFHTSFHQGYIITSSSVLYILLEKEQMLYQITHQEQMVHIIQYVLIQNEYIPMGEKEVLESSLLEALKCSYFLPFEELVPSEEVIHNTLALYRVSILKEHLEKIPSNRKKEYQLIQK